MATDAVVPNAAATSTAKTEQSVNPFESGILTRKLSDTWTAGRESEQPEKKETENAAAPDPSKATKSEDDKSKTAPAPETGKETKQETKEEPKPEPTRAHGAEKRIGELTAEKKAAQDENVRLKARITELEKPKPETAQPIQPEVQKLEPPKKPKLEAFQTMEEYDAACDKWVEDLADYKAKNAVQEYQKQQFEQARNQHFTALITDAKTRYANFQETGGTTLATLLTEAKTSPQVEFVSNVISRSPVLMDVLHFIGEKPENRDHFMATAKKDPLEAVRLAVIIEQQVLTEMQKGKAAKAEDGKKPGSEEVKEETKETPPAKTKTSEPAPQPTHEVGNRGTGPSDTAADAVRRAQTTPGQSKLTPELQQVWLRKRAQRM